jgi:hypothetical protein
MKRNVLALAISILMLSAAVSADQIKIDVREIVGADDRVFQAFGFDYELDGMPSKQIFYMTGLLGIYYELGSTSAPVSTSMPA